ncbi:MAG TPA: SPFH domain-containing protein [Polyangiaceae bacterium]|jgi:regulator of protease activity HflC (stomatin/prohibitin superfamily)
MRRSIIGLSVLGFGSLAMGTGCAGATIQPGHRALYFDPGNGGIQHEVLQPGWKRLACPFWEPDSKCPRVDDFDVTYQTAKEEMHVLSKEGLPLDAHVAVSYRPIVSELYLLDTDIGPNYFAEVIGPEFRSAAIGVFSHESYADLQRSNGAIEDRMEKALRERLKGKHIEVSSVLLEKVNYDPKILESQRERVVSQEETLRNKQLLENQASQEKRKIELQTEEIETRAAHKKTELVAQTEQKKLELQARAQQKELELKTELTLKKLEIQKDTEEAKFRIDSELRNKQAERKITSEQAQIDKMKAEAAAESQVVQAHGEAESRLALATATGAEKRAEAANITQNQVMMHAYDALGNLGGTGTTILMGDYSKLPNWLFPKMSGFQTFAPMVPLSPAGAVAPTLTATAGNPYTSGTK